MANQFPDRKQKYVNRKQPLKTPTQTHHNDDQDLRNQSNSWFQEGDMIDNLYTGKAIDNLPIDNE